MVDIGIILITLAVVFAIIIQIRQVDRKAAQWAALIAGTWLILQLALANSGWLANWHKPPPRLFLIMATTLVLVLALVFSRLGARMADTLPFAAIIGVQAFRLPLELVMHEAFRENMMPVQMTFTGWNFDIVTGLLAIPVAWLAAQGRASRDLIMAWNTMGTILLVVIICIAVVSTPTFAAFGPHRMNGWVAHAPYVWLPGALAPSALLGHALLWRKLARN